MASCTVATPGSPAISSEAEFAKFYPFPFSSASSDAGLDEIRDPKYPGTACLRLAGVLKRLSTLTPTDLSAPWGEVRSRLLWAGGLTEDRSTSHAFNDDNHCDLTTMRPDVADESNTGGEIVEISRRNHLGNHIRAASLSLTDEVGAGAPGGSWSTCTNGAHHPEPRDVAHIQFRSRVAFKLVWLPPSFGEFVLLDDEGRVLTRGAPESGMPNIGYRQRNYELVRGGSYDYHAQLGGGIEASDSEQKMVA